MYESIFLWVCDALLDKVKGTSEWGNAYIFSSFSCKQLHKFKINLNLTSIFNLHAFIYVYGCLWNTDIVCEYPWHVRKYLNTMNGPY